MPRTFIISLVLTVLTFVSIQASDHIDGPVTSKHRITDLTDFYAFKTQEADGYLTLIANVHPLTLEKSHFDSKVFYRFTLRPAEIDVTDSVGRISTVAKDEKIILCTFHTPGNHKRHTMTCVADKRLKRTVRFNGFDVRFDGSGLRLFAGHRADPFFFNADFAKAAAQKRYISKPIPENTMEKTNALSMVVEVNVEKLFGRPVSQIAMTVESLAKREGKVYRYDRIGRPEVTNVTMVTRPGYKELRDKFNWEKSFRESASAKAEFVTRISKNVRYYDALDGTRDWTLAQREAYGTIIADDFLLIDLSQPEKAASKCEYFSIETDVLQGREPDSRGGRRLNDDIMDRLFTILINNDKGRKIQDGVNGPTPKVSANFPYLARPDFSWSAWFKAKIADWFI